MFDTMQDLDPVALAAVVESTHRQESVLVLHCFAIESLRPSRPSISAGTR